MVGRLQLPNIAKVPFTGADQKSGKQAKRRAEVSRYRSLLSDWQMELGALPDVCPKDPDARQRAMQIARIVATDANFRSLVEETAILPIEVLANRFPQWRQTIEQYDTYILAMAVLFSKDFPELQTWLEA